MRAVQLRRIMNARERESSNNRNMKRLTWIPYLLILFLPYGSGVILSSLNDSTILIEKLGKASLYDDELTLLIAVDLGSIIQSANNIKQLLNETRQQCKDCQFEPQITATDRKISSAVATMNHLMFEIPRNDTIDSAPKFVFETPEYSDDLDVFQKYLDRLFDDNNNITNIKLNQTNIIRASLNQTNSDGFTKLHKKSQQLYVETNDEYNILVQLMAIESLISDLMENVNTVNTALSLGKNGTIQPELVTPNTFLNGLREIRETTLSSDPIEAKSENYQILLSISSVRILIHSGKLIYHISVPSLEDTEYAIKRLYPIPQKRGKTFVALVLYDNVVIESEQEIILLNDQFFKEQCIIHNQFTLCKRKRLDHLIVDSQSLKVNSHVCQWELLHTEMTNNCDFALFKISDITYIPIGNSNRFIVVPENPTTIHARETNQMIPINSPSIIYSDNDCTLLSENTTMKIGGNPKDIEFETRTKNISIKYTSEDLDAIYGRLGTTNVISINFNGFRTPLDKMNDEPGKLKARYSIQTSTSSGYSIRDYAGILAIIIIVIYLFCKCGVLFCLRDLCCLCCRCCGNSGYIEIRSNNDLGDEPLRI